MKCHRPWYIGNKCTQNELRKDDCGQRSASWFRSTYTWVPQSQPERTHFTPAYLSNHFSKFHQMFCVCMLPMAVVFVIKRRIIIIINIIMRRLTRHVSVTRMTNRRRNMLCTSDLVDYDIFSLFSHNGACDASMAEYGVTHQGQRGFHVAAYCIVNRLNVGRHRSGLMSAIARGPHLQNILRQSYDCLTIMP